MSYTEVVPSPSLATASPRLFSQPMITSPDSAVHSSSCVAVSSLGPSALSLVQSPFPIPSCFPVGSRSVSSSTARAEFAEYHYEQLYGRLRRLGKKIVLGVDALGTGAQLSACLDEAEQVLIELKRRKRQSHQHNQQQSQQEQGNSTSRTASTRTATTSTSETERGSQHSASSTESLNVPLAASATASAAGASAVGALSPVIPVLPVVPIRPLSAAEFLTLSPSPYLTHLVVTSCSNYPLVTFRVDVQCQFTITRKEAKRLKTDQRETLISIPVRVMGTSDRQHLYLVAKDVCQLIHLRQSSVAKAVHNFSDTERVQMPVFCQRSSGSGCTQVLTVLTECGVERLMRDSRQPSALGVWEWLRQQMTSVKAGLGVNTDQQDGGEETERGAIYFPKANKPQSAFSSAASSSPQQVYHKTQSARSTNTSFTSGVTNLSPVPVPERPQSNMTNGEQPFECLSLTTPAGTAATQTHSINMQQQQHHQQQLQALGNHPIIPAFVVNPAVLLVPLHTAAVTSPFQPPSASTQTTNNPRSSSLSLTHFQQQELQEQHQPPVAMNFMHHLLQPSASALYASNHPLPFPSPSYTHTTAYLSNSAHLPNVPPSMYSSMYSPSVHNNNPLSVLGTIINQQPAPQQSQPEVFPSSFLHF